MASNETEELAMWSGVAGLTSIVGAYSLHEAVAKGYSLANDVEWRQIFSMHGGAAGVLALAGGLGYSIGRWKLTPEGMSVMGLGAGLMVSDINDAAKWFESFWDALIAILIAFFIGLIIGWIIRFWLEWSADDTSRSVA